MNQSQFPVVTCDLLKAREKSRVHGGFGFGFAWSFSLVEKLARVLLANHWTRQLQSRNHFRKSFENCSDPIDLIFFFRCFPNLRYSYQLTMPHLNVGWKRLLLHGHSHSHSQPKNEIKEAKHYGESFQTTSSLKQFLPDLRTEMDTMHAKDSDLLPCHVNK